MSLSEMPFKPISEETCAGCGKLMVVRNGESFTASTDGKVWHYGCSPRLKCLRKDGDAGDAIDFACDHAKEPVFFLEDWRKDGAQEWPEYHRWLAVQRAGASRAETHKPSPDHPSEIPVE